MITHPDGNLHIFTLSVGQGDTTIVVFPGGRVLVIDAMRPSKILRLLSNLGNDSTIEYLIITHPHSDHFSGCNRLASDRTIEKAAVAPFWHQFGMGPPTYRGLMGRFEQNGTDVTFLSGYARWYPDGALTDPPPGQDLEIDEDKPYLELLGPTNGLMDMLEDSNVFNTNHLTIMTRLTWRGFRMIIAGDAQMENWQYFDQERLLNDKCQILRAAHHGSANGTQWERIDRLNPSHVIVSSDPDATHDLPDLSGSAIFASFDRKEGRIAAITRNTGTIQLTVSHSGVQSIEMYGELPTEDIDFTHSVALNEISNPTDWNTLVQTRLDAL